jgi:Tripartite tricarboxylate transporter TctB family
MSQDTPPAAAPSPAVARNCTVDTVVAAILFMLGAVVVYEARRLGATWTSDGPGAGYFPFYIGVIVCVSALGIVFEAQWKKPRDDGAFVDREQLSRVLQVLLPAVVYVLAISYLGVYVASALYIALFMIVLGKYPAFKSVLLALVFNAIFFAMFEAWFKVPLFKGSLDPLRALGY